MTSTSDIGVLAKLAYQAGITPLDFAEEQVTIHVSICLALVTVADEFGLSPDDPRLTVDAAACRILGALLDAGWSPPVLIPEPGVPQ